MQNARDCRENIRNMRECMRPQGEHQKSATKHQRATSVISLLLCVKVRCYRNRVALAAVLKGPGFPNLMKTTVPETLKAQHVTGPQREATKAYPLEAPQKSMSIWYSNFQYFGPRVP